MWLTTKFMILSFCNAWLVQMEKYGLDLCIHLIKASLSAAKALYCLINVVLTLAVIPLAPVIIIGVYLRFRHIRRKHESA